MREPHDPIGMHFDPAPTTELPTQAFAAGLTLNFLTGADFLPLVHNSTR